MILESFPVGPLGCNCTIVADEASRDAIVVDPGGDLDVVRARLGARDLRARAIVHTHTHIDHVGATAGLQRATGAPARVHEADAFLYRILPVQAQLVGLPEIPEVGDLDAWLRDDEVLRAGAVELRVVHTPGHTPGSCCFEVRAGAASPGGTDDVVLLAGDTLFQRSVGRTDLWGGDHDALVASIRERLFALPDPTRVVCGHGPETTIGGEKRHNPFVRPLRGG